MKNIVYIFVFSIFLSLTSCSDNRSPNYQFMPNMYESVGYEAYSEGELFLNGQSSRLPAQGSVPRGHTPYDFEDTNEDRERAKAELKNPLPVTEENLAAGKELYGYFCAVCHGDKGDGKGILAQREKFLGIPSYADPGRVINEGGIYHVQMYGLNAMGAFTPQTTPEERWQITMHVLNLKAELEGTQKLVPVSEAEAATAQEEVTASENEQIEE
ncbi:MAG: cytochrome c [Flavobacteriaceae bacterium]|nr:cytochrome c [Flavobacteriaceae bacterium]